jgi:hypothetical protein
MLARMGRSAVLGLSLVLSGCGFGLFDFGDDAEDEGEGDAGEGDGWGEVGGTPTEGGGGFTEGGGGFTDGGGSFTEGGEPTTGIEPTGADNEPPVDGQCPCVADNTDIYLLSDTGAIWSMDPSDNSFTFITNVECGGMTDTFSMGVSRKGRAWVQYVSGDLYNGRPEGPGQRVQGSGLHPGRPEVPELRHGLRHQRRL